MSIAVPDSITHDEAEFICRQLLAGRAADLLAAQFGDRGLDVRRFARQCGAPNDQRRIRTVLAVLEGGEEDSLPTGTSAHESTTLAEARAAAQRIVDLGRKSNKVATVRLADRTKELIDRLTTTLHLEDHERANADEIARLQRRIDELRGKTVKPPTATSARKARQKEDAAIRAWAVEHGIECSARGFIAQHVRDAYAGRDAA